MSITSRSGKNFVIFWNFSSVGVFYALSIEMVCVYVWGGKATDPLGGTADPSIGRNLAYH